jgi:hypothetical protein
MEIPTVSADKKIICSIIFSSSAKIASRNEGKE